MRFTIIFVCLAVIPTSLLFSNNSAQKKLYGLWYDAYTDTQIEIKHHRKGVKVRAWLNGRKKKWRTYYRMGKGVYDDCNGRTLIVLRGNRIEWRNGRRNRIILEPYRGYGSDYGRRNRYDDYDDYNFRNNRDYGRRYNNRDRYYGDWYCPDYGLDLRIESYRDGFRARKPGGSWIYYNRFNDREYRDRKGNRYFLEGNDLIWSSGKDRRRFKFKRK